MAYFNYFPKISYDVRGKKNDLRLDTITNILIRNRKKLEVTDRGVFEEYFIQDGDRADILAFRFYNDSTLHWIIMYANYINNPYYDWPLTYFDLQKFIAKKYTTPTDTKHYEDADGYIVESDVAGATAISYSLYEERLNDLKRQIKIIKPEYVPQIIQEFKNLTE